MEKLTFLSTSELVDYLIQEEKVEYDVIEPLERNKISGALFGDLTDDILKELYPTTIGNRLIISGILLKLRNNSCSPAGSLSGTPKGTPTHTSTLKGLGNQEATLLTPKATVGSWVDTFEIPSEYSFETKKAMQSGILTKSARVEIVGAVASRMIQVTRTPTPSEYQGICKKLILKYPKLQDPFGNGYGTWKCQFRNKFKNWRRGENPIQDRSEAGKTGSTSHDVDDCPRDDLDDSPHDDLDDSYLDADGLENEDDLPKKRKKRNHGDIDIEYENNKYLIEREWSKANPKISKLKGLMDVTFKKRRSWMKETCPSATEVLEKYPCLLNVKIVRHELRKLIGLTGSCSDILKSWDDWMKRAHIFATMERKTRTCLKDIKLFKEDDSADTKGISFLSIISSLLLKKVKNAPQLLYEFQDTVDLDNEIAKIDRGTPFILMLKSEEAEQFFVVVEKQMFTESCSLSHVIVDVIAAYFAFDIVYPKALYPLLIFLQHHVLGIKDGQTEPNNVKILLSSLSKITF